MKTKDRGLVLIRHLNREPAPALSLCPATLVPTCYARPREKTSHPCHSIVVWSKALGNSTHRRCEPQWAFQTGHQLMWTRVWPVREQRTQTPMPRRRERACLRLPKISWISSQLDLQKYHKFDGLNHLSQKEPAACRK